MKYFCFKANIVYSSVKYEVVSKYFNIPILHVIYQYQVFIFKFKSLNEYTDRPEL